MIIHHMYLLHKTLIVINGAKCLKTFPTHQLVLDYVQTLPLENTAGELRWTVEGVANTQAIVLIACTTTPLSIELDGRAISDFNYSVGEGLLYIRFPNEARPRVLTIKTQ